MKTTESQKRQKTARSFERELTLLSSAFKNRRCKQESDICIHHSISAIKFSDLVTEVIGS